MTMAPQAPKDSPAQSAQAAPTLKELLQQARPLLLSIAVDGTISEEAAVAFAAEQGAHIVRRHINASEQHVYKVVGPDIESIDFRCLFIPPANIDTLALTVVTAKDGEVVTPAAEEGPSPVDGSPVAHQGSPVAHGDSGADEFTLTKGEPDFYFIITAAADQPKPDEPYTFAVAGMP